VHERIKKHFGRKRSDRELMREHAWDNSVIEPDKSDYRSTGRL
jgi:hypothetical protein